MDERAAFEANIDANPLDAQNHLVYSDWLRENGHEDEADFRKAMGEFHSNSPFVDGHEPQRHFFYDVINHPLPVGTEGQRVRGSGVRAGNWEMFHGYRDFENGVRRAFMANRSTNSSQQMSRRVRARRYARRIK